MKNVGSNHNSKQTGALGESLACQYLISIGHKILERNFWRKYGEIDIISIRNDVVHFVEVKAVSHETKDQLLEAVTRGTWRPEERVNKHKLQRIHRMIEVWIAENKYYPGEWQIDVLTVRMVMGVKFASVNLIENIT